MKDATELLADWNRLDRESPAEDTVDAPDDTTDVQETATVNEESPVEEIPEDAPEVESPEYDTPPEQVEPVIAGIDEPAISREAVDEPADVNVVEPDVEAVGDVRTETNEPVYTAEPDVRDDVPPALPDEPIATDTTVESVEEPDVPETSVEAAPEPDVPETSVEAASEPDAAVDQPEFDESPREPQLPVDEIQEPTVPSSDVDDISTVVGETHAEEPVGFMGDVVLPDAAIEQYQSGELDDTPSMDDVDRQVARQVQHEQQRGDDLSARLHEDLMTVFQDMRNEQAAIVQDAIEIESLTLSMMRD